MKKLLLLLLLVPILSFVSDRSKTDLLGKWIGEDKNEIGHITFDTNGYVTMEFDGETMGGQDFEMDGKSGSLIYETNFNVTPIRIDLVFITQDDIERKRLQGIIEFINDDSLRYAINFGGGIPDDFGEENTIVLNRVKE